MRCLLTRRVVRLRNTNNNTIVITEVVNITIAVVIGVHDRNAVDKVDVVEVNIATRASLSAVVLSLDAEGLVGTRSHLDDVFFRWVEGTTGLVAATCKAINTP